jgi:major membrane immunogen (membrane-anchored lipoprotein)
MKKIGLLFIMVALISLESCKEEEAAKVYQNGTYSAETAEYSHGWITFMEVTISDDKQTTVTFDCRNEEGGLKSETTEETYPMDPHPTVWIPELEAQYMAVDIINYSTVDGITGATHGSDDSMALFQLMLDAAKEGDTVTQILPTPEPTK